MPVPNWLSLKNDKEKKDDEEEIELKPKDIKAKFDSIDSIKAQLDSYGENFKKLDSISEYIEEQREAKRKADEAAARANKEKQNKEEEESLDFLTDPANAVKTLVGKQLNEVVNPLIKMTVANQAKQGSKEFYDSNPAFELYTDPDFRQYVDSLVQALPLNQQNNQEAWKNCYYVAAGRKAQEIKDGKIKARFASVSNGATGTGQVGDKAEKELVLTNDMKKAAAMFGMKEEEYAKAFRQEHGI